MRKNRSFTILLCKTNRFRDSFINSSARFYEKCLQSRLSEHINPTKSAIGQHFHSCQHVQYIVNLHFAFDKLYNPTDEYNNISDFF